MIKFAKKRYFTPPGAAIRTTYELRISTKTGQPELFEKGKEDFNDYIQSFAESCDLKNIIRRINAGELDLLNARPGTYGDFLGAPEYMQAAMNARIDAKNTWSNLSKEQQAMFGSFEEFCATAGSFEWLKNLGVEFKEDVKESDEVADDKQ